MSGLGDEEVSGCLHRGREPLLREVAERDRDGAVLSECFHRGGQPLLGQDRGVDAVGQLAELANGQPQFAVCLVDQAGEPRGGGRAGLGAGQAERQGERDELLLGAIVQVSLKPPPLGVAGRDDPGLCGSQVVELGPEPRRAAAHSPCPAGRRPRPR